jgi:hypothetical protein
MADFISIAYALTVTAGGLLGDTHISTPLLVVMAEYIAKGDNRFHNLVKVLKGVKRKWHNKTDQLVNTFIFHWSYFPPLCDRGR